MYHVRAGRDAKQPAEKWMLPRLERGLRGLATLTYKKGIIADKHKL